MVSKIKWEGELLMLDVLCDICGRCGNPPSSEQLDRDMVAMFDLPYQAEQAVVPFFKHVLLADLPFLSGGQGRWHVNNREQPQ